MKKTPLLILTAAALVSCSGLNVTSPNKEFSVNLFSDTDGAAMLRVENEGICLMDSIKLGLSTGSQTWDSGLKISTKGGSRKIVENYTMLQGKKLECSNEANERIFAFKNAEGAELQLILRAYNDGVAFKYLVPQTAEGEVITAELTTFNIPDGTKRWIQANPGFDFEGFYPLATDGQKNGGWKQRKPDWNFPALVEPADGRFILISEAGLRRDHCGSYLTNGENLTKYRTAMADDSLAVNGNSWESAWRVMIAGELSDIVESTLVNDVSDPCVIEDTDWIRPGLVSWIYWANNHGSSDYKIVTEYMDLACEMGWPYNLIDAEWDEMSNGGNIEDALAYSRSIGVSSMVWYNSSTGWINGAPTPYYRLNAPEDREKEFSWLNRQGAAGIKVDFFKSDEAQEINYCYDLMDDAAKHHLTINFHGATLPRGWQRTYPNLMSMEAVYGAEWYNNMPILTNRAAAHNATLPFTRNVVGSMDYTPGTFSDSQHPHITSHGHELALMVLFESSMQHMPDSPETYRSLPQQVKDLLSTLPTIWEDTKLLAGYPGESAVIARRYAGKWYIAGINGKDEAQTLRFSLERLAVDGQAISGAKALAFTDGPAEREFAIAQTTLEPELSIDCLPRGGFLIVCE